jgi:hypothetical protein
MMKNGTIAIFSTDLCHAYFFRAQSVREWMVDTCGNQLFPSKEDFQTKEMNPLPQYLRKPDLLLT